METKTKIYIGAGLLVTAIAAYFVLRPKKGKLFGSRAEGGFINEGDINSPSVFNAKQKAQTLHEIMRGMWSNKKDILEEFVGVTKAQFAQIVKAFGNRPYNTLTGNTKAVYGFDLPLLPLKSWLKSELDTDMYKQLRQMYLQYL